MCMYFSNALTNSNEIIFIQDILDSVIWIQYGGAFGLPNLVNLLLGMSGSGLGLVVPP